MNKTKKQLEEELAMLKAENAKLREAFSDAYKLKAKQDAEEFVNSIKETVGPIFDKSKNALINLFGLKQ